MDRTRAVSDEALLEVAGFDVAWVEAGVEVRRPLRDAVGIAFENVPPVRDFPSYRGQRSFRDKTPQEQATGRPWSLPWRTRCGCTPTARAPSSRSLPTCTTAPRA